MCALPPKADIGRHLFEVRFVPEADKTRERCTFTDDVRCAATTSTAQTSAEKR
jgi:hypothetical protein